MKKSFKVFYEASGKTFPDELYHVTYSRNLRSIIQSNKMKLSFAYLGGWDQKINKDKFFYLSMSYDKYGRYASGSNRAMKNRIPPGAHDVILVMDTKKLSQKGKLIDVDYWESGKYSDDEREVRFISDKQTLENPQDYIKEAHIFVRQPESERDKAEYREVYLRNLLRIEEQNNNIPVYFYDNPKAFRLTLKSMSKPLNKAIPRKNIEYKKSEKHADLYKKHNQMRNPEIKALINLLKGISPERESSSDVKKRMESYLNFINSYPRDFEPSVSSDLHNAKMDNPEEFQELVNLFRQYRIKTLKDLFYFIKEKYKHDI